MSEYNVCGVLVMIQPDELEVVTRTLNETAGVEVHGDDGKGRLVVTVEDHSSGHCSDTITEISRMSGVLSASLVYHETTNDEALKETAQ